MRRSADFVFGIKLYVLRRKRAVNLAERGQMSTMKTRWFRVFGCCVVAQYLLF
jgi:hypothetical protein